MSLTIHRYLFAAMLGLIGLDLIIERLTEWLMPLKYAAPGEDISCLFVAFAYLLAMLGVLTAFRSGPAVEFWGMVLKTSPKLRGFLSVILSILQVVLWAQVISVIKMGHSAGLESFESNSIKVLQIILPIMVVVALPAAIVLNKWKNNLLNKLVANWTATISDSPDKVTLFEYLNRLVVFERYRKNWEMADTYSRIMLALVEERTHKVKRVQRPKLRQPSLRKCG